MRTFDLDLGRNSQKQLVAVSHGLKGFHGTAGIVFPMVGLVLSERCNPRFFAEEIAPCFFGAKTLGTQKIRQTPG